LLVKYLILGMDIKSSLEYIIVTHFTENKYIIWKNIMALSINPVVKRFATTQSQGFVSAVNRTGNNLAMPGTNALKDKLANTVNRLSAGIGSGLNGITAGINDGVSSLRSTIQSSLPLNELSSIATGVGVLSNAARDIAGLSQLIATGGAAKTISKIADASSKIAAAAGLANDLIGLARSKNLPLNLPSFNKPGDIVKVAPATEGDWRVKVSSPFGDIIFPVLPSISLAFTANYSAIDIVHSNYQFLAYKNSQPSDITISCEWPVETVADGDEYLNMVLAGRSNTKMYYGTSGLPPPICTLSGYGDVILPSTPVVVKSFQIELKDDVSYITVGNDKVPRLSTVTIVVTPTFSRTAQRSFDLDVYSSGGGSIKY
jgi:hypothetical protein